MVLNSKEMKDLKAVFQLQSESDSGKDTNMNTIEFAYQLYKSVEEGLLDFNELNEIEKQIYNHQKNIIDLVKKIKRQNVS